MRTRATIHGCTSTWRLKVGSAAEQRAEIGRLTGLGARLADWDHYPADSGFVVLEDTEATSSASSTPATNPATQPDKPQLRQ
jgi:hypothetical protein